jgi:hypothetical protein
VVLRAKVRFIVYFRRLKSINPMIKIRSKTLVLATAAAGMLGAGAVQSRASILITIQESGADVVATATGSADLGGLTQSSSAQRAASVFPSSAAIGFGTIPGVSVPHYSIPVAPSSFGSGTFVAANSTSGQIFAIAGAHIYFPANYVSKTSFNSTATWNGQTFSTLGITPGTYVYSWGSGANADSVTLTAGAVPEPEEYAAVAGGLCLAMAAWRRFKRAA